MEKTLVLPTLVVIPLLLFWVFMVSHAVKNDIPNKQMWLLIVILGSVFGAVIYYFEIYTKMDRP